MRQAAALALAAMLAPALLGAQAITPAPLRTGEVAFAMRATKVNDFVGHAPVAQAEFHGTDLANVTGVVVVHLVDMHTGIGLRDTHMRHAMHADSFPDIRFELVGVEAGTTQGDSTAATFRGNMTIHGLTKEIRVPGYIVLHGASADVTATFPLDMREYAIDPPTRFFGAIRVDPITTITVHLSFGPQ